MSIYNFKNKNDNLGNNISVSMSAVVIHSSPDGLRITWPLTASYKIFEKEFVVASTDNRHSTPCSDELVNGGCYGSSHV